MVGDLEDSTKKEKISLLGFYMGEMSKEYPWGGSRRFNAYPDYMRKKFGGRVQKLTIDAGFSCPNRDGTKGLRRLYLLPE